MKPDIPTIFIVGTLICGLAAVLQWMVAGRRHSRPLMIWAATNFVFSLGCAAHAVRPITSLMFSVVAGNGLMIFGTGLIVVGLEIFEGRKPNWPELVAGPLLAVTALAVAVMHGPRPGELAFIVSLAIAYYLIRAGYRLWGLSCSGAMGVRMACSLLMLVFSTLYVLRGAATYGGVLDPVLADQGLVGAVIRLFALLMATGWSVCSMVLVLDREASRDTLTGLLNRGAAWAAGGKLVSEAIAKGRAVAVLALDVDHFKLVNDQYGHAAGDEVLRLLGQIISQAVRDGDVVGRVGGEEFCVVLPLADEARARRVAERLRERCEHTLAQLSKLPEPVSISIGIAILTPGDADFAALFKRADVALYQAKSSGRNTVVFASEPVVKRV